MGTMFTRKGDTATGDIDLRTPFTETDFEPPSTLVDLLRWRAFDHPRQHAFAFLGDGEAEESFVDYEELDRRAQTVAARLQTMEVARGERALLFYPPSPEYVAAFLGCLYAGVVAVPAYPPRNNRYISRLRAIVADSKASVALTNTRILSSLERRVAYASGLKPLHWLATDDGEDVTREWRYPELSGNTLALLQYTSGSTVSPKGVMLSHGNLLHNLAMIYHGLGHTPHSQAVIWLPPYHDMGLIGGVLQPLYGGFPVALMAPTSFLQRPFRWLQAISRLRANTSGGPNFAYELCSLKVTPEERATLDLSSWEVALTGGEPIREATMERFAAAFARCGFRREAFYPAYGLAEATLLVSGGPRTAAPVVLSVEGAKLKRDWVVETQKESKDVRPLVSCGRTPADQKVVVVNLKSLTRCPSDRVGEIWVSGPSIAQGYWGRAEETQHAFSAYLADTGEGPFLRTGDLGFLHHGELFVTGRLKDLIIIRGANHYPQDIERTAEQSHVALRPGSCAAFSVNTNGGEQLVIVQELEHRSVKSSDVGEVITSIRCAVAEQHELQVHAIVLIKPGSIPKTSSGKIQRRATRAAYSDGSLAAVTTAVFPADVGTQDADPETVTPSTPPSLGAVEDDRVLSMVRDFVWRRGHSESVRYSDSLQRDLGLDSLAVAELLIEVEVVCKVRLGDSVIAGLRTVKDLYDEVFRASQAEPQGSSTPAGIGGLQDRMIRQIPQLGAVVSEQDGRDVKIAERWYSDFASANYLGLDLHPTVLASIPNAIKRWGVHPSWTRAVASPQIYKDLEQEIARFIRAPYILLFPTITLLHSGVLPILASGDSVILLDRAAHNSMQEAAQLAGARGTAVDWFDHNDPKDLERRLELHEERCRKIIAVDGVYSMSGAYPPLSELVRLARKHGARLYVDDAHGFGVVGENPTAENPYGDLGNGIVRYFGLRHDEDIVYVGGMSKAFSSMVAFITCADEAEKRRLSMASTSVFSGPCPTGSLASAIAGLRISQDYEGSAIRRRLLNMTRQLVVGARGLGFTVDNNQLFPLVNIRIGTVSDVVKACNVLWEHGILITPALFPAVPIDCGGLRFTVTSANTSNQVRLAIEALRKVRKELLTYEEPPVSNVSPTQ